MLGRKEIVYRAGREKFRSNRRGRAFILRRCWGACAPRDTAFEYEVRHLRPEPTGSDADPDAAELQGPFWQSLPSGRE